MRPSACFFHAFFAVPLLYTIKKCKLSSVIHEEQPLAYSAGRCRAVRLKRPYMSYSAIPFLMHEKFGTPALFYATLENIDSLNTQPKLARVCQMVAKMFINLSAVCRADAWVQLNIYNAPIKKYFSP